MKVLVDKDDIEFIMIVLSPRVCDGIYRGGIGDGS